MGSGGSKPLPKGPTVTSHDRAILEVKVQRDRLKQYQKKLALVTQRETEIAKEHYAKDNKALAILTLKKRNYQQGLLDKTYDQLLNLEQLVQSIEFALVETQVVSGLKQGNAILGELQKELRIEDVELLLEETTEAVAYQNEISQMLSGGQIDSSVVLDEDELLQELNELAGVEAEELVFPSVPTAVPSAKAEAEAPGKKIQAFEDFQERQPVLLEE